MNPSMLTTIVIAVGFAVDRDPGRLPGTGPRPGRHRGSVHPLTCTRPQGTLMTSTAADGNSSLALPVLDDRPRGAAARPDGRGRGAARAGDPQRGAVRHRGGAAPACTPAASGSGPLLVLLAAEAGDADRRRRDHRGLRGRADPPRLALPRRRDGRGRPAPRRRVGQLALGQPRRDPHRRLPVLEVLGADRRRSGADAVRIQAETFTRLVEGQILETLDARARRGPARALPAGGRGQDRLADRDLGALRRPVRRRHRSRSRRRSRRTARRSASPSSSPTTSSTSPPSPTSPARRPAPTCARACRRCRC